ncbi:ABC transporter ATP-binding protein [uncultured Roseibium sp.]|uniref:ABC transporter ATP-binding protein n=1 Tax=uncultured Roseibium sp. TaxID=1936171 RepID=UPI00261EF6F8|nr:ABC transporter ATP-binding protein [uncultured Roseibium sp.]
MDDVVLETRGLCKNYGALEVSKNISLTLRKGEVHAVIGPNGAGKSTLIHQICGTVRPDFGSIYLLDEDVTQKPVDARSKAGLARTFQVSALAMEDTVLENVVLGCVGASGKAFRLFQPVLTDRDLLETAHIALERVGLEDVAEKRTADLSHGQRRQLEVAIALTLAPKAFVMDEPMAGLGAEGSKRMTGFLDTLRAEAPILLVEHDMDAVFALADRISVLVYGSIIASGTVEEIRSDPGVREAYLGDEA